MEDGRPISYEALTVGTPVLSASGFQFGKVEKVLQIPELDEFDGISVTTEHGLRHVKRDQITDITTNLVRCDLDDDAVAALPEPHGTRVLHADLDRPAKLSFTARIARVFKGNKDSDLI